MPELRQKIAAQSTILSTELSGLLNGARVLSSTINNVQGGGGLNGYTHIMLHLAVDFVSAPTANTGCFVWLLRSADAGSTFEDGSASVAPARPYDGFLALNATVDPQVVSCVIPLPPGHFKLLIQNSSGQAFPASGSTLRGAAFTMELV